MTAPKSLSALRSAMATAAPDMVARCNDGEYRVTFSLVAIAAAFPDWTRAEMIDKAESVAAYETDAESALATAIAMTAIGLRPAPLKLTGSTATAEPAARDDGAKVVGFIDMTPTWAEMLPVMLLVMTDGNATGRASIKIELERMAALADQRNVYAGNLATIRAAADLCDAEQARLANTKGAASWDAINSRDAMRSAVRAALA